MKKCCWIIAIIFLGMAIIGFDLFRQLEQWWRAPAANPYFPTYIEIEPGQSILAISQSLQQAGVINNANYFKWLIRLHHAGKSMKAGEYLIPIAATPYQIFVMLHQGNMMQHSITLVEGWTFMQIIEALHNQPLLKQTVTQNAPDVIMQNLGASEANPEGLFMPNTYFYTKGMADKVVLQRAYNAMQQFLQQAWGNRAENLPYTTPYQALIAASIIEKESAIASERPLVASVIVNRLNLGMPLQMDPTVIYGLGSQYNGSITTKDLQTDTLYNTYTRKGLPPTPIAMPSANAIQAALHPANTQYLYFVANGDGSHQFSENLTQHDKAVRAYLQWLKRNKTSTSGMTKGNNP